MGCGASKDAPAGGGDAPAKQPAYSQPAPEKAAAPPSAPAGGEAAGAYNNGSAAAGGEAEPSADYKGNQGSRRKTATVRRIAISAEKTDDSPPAEKVFVEKTPEVHKQLTDAVKAHPLFEYLDEEIVKEVVDSMAESKYTAGQNCIKQGEPGDHFYIVSSGCFEAFLAANGSEPIQEYGANDSFGELALLYNSPRAATVTCKDEGVCYSLERRAFRAQVMHHNTKTKHGLKEHLKTVPILSSIEEALLTELAEAASVVNFTDGDYIIKMKEKADSLFLILSGEVVCHKGDGEELMRLSTGQFFGESAIAEGGNTERQANVVAVGPVRVCCWMGSLNVPSFRKLLSGGTGGQSLQNMISRNFSKKVLDCVELLQYVDTEEKEELLDVLEEQLLNEGDTVVEAGSPGTTFYIIKTGSVNVLKDGVEVANLKAAAYFGERSLLTEESVSATIVCAEATTLMKLGKDQFECLLGPLQKIMERDHKRREAAVKFQERKAQYLWDDLDVRVILGEGSFGRVKLCLHKPTGQVFALKCMRKGQIIRYQQVDHVVGEKRVLAMCDHPFVLKMVAVFNRGPQIYMCLEMAPGGELFSLLRNMVRFDEPTAALYGAMVTAAFGYLHARKIAHRDLKHENLLYDAEGYLKLVDMGFAKVINDRTWTLCGTPEYLAPEIISNKGHNIGADWWTLGILLYEMLVGHPPFVAESQVDTYHKIMRGKYKVPQNMGKPSKDIISRLLVHTPSGRLGCWRNGTRDVMGHDFYKSIDWQKLEAKQLTMPHIPALKDKLDTSNFDSYPEEDNSSWDRYIDEAHEETWKEEFG